MSNSRHRQRHSAFGIGMGHLVFGMRSCVMPRHRHLRHEVMGHVSASAWSRFQGYPQASWPSVRHLGVTGMQFGGHGHGSAFGIGGHGHGSAFGIHFFRGRGHQLGIGIGHQSWLGIRHKSSASSSSACLLGHGHGSALVFGTQRGSRNP